MTTKPIQEILPNGIIIEMMPIKGGSCMMGNKGKEGEPPLQEIHISDFYLSKYPVTHAHFLPFLQEVGNKKEGGEYWVALDGSYENVRCGIELDQGGFRCVPGLEHHPMVYVSWFGARAYCKWLSEKTEYDYRLPNEAEWEYAAKGGQYSQGYRYAGSNKLGEVGWYQQNSHRETKPVGLKMCNELGIYDLSGNVEEWCADNLFGDDSGEYEDGTLWNKLKDGKFRVVRGGSWNYFDISCQVSSYNFWEEWYRYYDTGFRLARN